MRWVFRVVGIGCGLLAGGSACFACPPCPKKLPYCITDPPPSHCEATIIERFKAGKPFTVIVGGQTMTVVPEEKKQ